MYDAAIIYCRALIEYATYKLRKRINFIKVKSDITKLKPALEQVKGLINPKIYDNIIIVKELADEILHSKDANINYKLTPFDAIR